LGKGEGEKGDEGVSVEPFLPGRGKVRYADDPLAKTLTMGKGGGEKRKGAFFCRTKRGGGKNGVGR